MSTGSPSSALREYNDGKYDQSLKDYQQLLERKDDPRLRFNAGAAAYRDGQFDEAAKQFDEALSSPDLKLQEKAYFNRGNTLYYLGERQQDQKKRNDVWNKSLQDFQSTLKLNPQDPDAKFNYQYVKRKLEELKQQQQQQQQSKSDQQQNKDQQKQQQQNQPNQNQKQDQNQQQQQAQQNKEDQQKQDSSQQNQQNQQAQQQKQDQQKQESEQSRQQQAKQQQEQKDQQQASAQPAKPEDKSGEKDQNEAVAYAPGQMTPQQARQLLDAQRDDEQPLPVKPEGKPSDATRAFKDW